MSLSTVEELPSQIPGSLPAPKCSSLYLNNFVLTYRPSVFTCSAFCIRNAFPFSCRQALFDTLSGGANWLLSSYFFPHFLLCVCVSGVQALLLFQAVNEQSRQAQKEGLGEREKSISGSYAHSSCPAVCVAGINTSGDGVNMVKLSPHNSNATWHLVEHSLLTG